MDERSARVYVNAVHWKFAKTYAKTAPHEYTVRKWRPELQPHFEGFAQYIRDNGTPEIFAGREYTYLAFDGFKYWTMGSPIDETIIINRIPI
jgi:hypothetical protein